MANNFPDPAVENPWFDGTQWWEHDGGGWRRLPGPPQGMVLTGYKNVIINGDFRVNQRSFDGNWFGHGQTYGYDRWIKSGDNVSIYQKIEALNIVEGETYTFSWDGGGAGKILDGGANEIASGDSPIVFTMPAPQNNLGGYYYVPFANATKVQLEKGTVATEFETRGYGLEYSLCQRYYQKHTGNNNHPVLAMYVEVSGKWCIDTCRLPVQMRASGAITSTHAAVGGTWQNIGVRAWAAGIFLSGNCTSTSSAPGYLLTEIILDSEL